MHARWPRPGIFLDHSGSESCFPGLRLWPLSELGGDAAWGRGRGAQFSGQYGLHEARGGLQAAQRLIQGAGAQEQSGARRARLPWGTPVPGAQLDLTLGHRPRPGGRGTLLQCHLHTLELRWTRTTGPQLQVSGPAGATVCGLGLWCGGGGRRGPRRRETTESPRGELLHLTIRRVRGAEQGPGAEDDFHLPRRQHAQLGLGWARARASLETRAGPELLAAILGADGQARLCARPQRRGHPGPIRPALYDRPNVWGLWRTRSCVVGA